MDDSKGKEVGDEEKTTTTDEFLYQMATRPVARVGLEGDLFSHRLCAEEVTGF